MRKFLSLVLALVMMMSLVTINAGAKEFTDDSDITYQEAVDVISTIKVVDGYDNGSYNPKGNLTRGAAAKIICNLILGPTTAAELHADTAPFRDVPVTHDFAGYIAYCQKEGIISGYADGSFRPAGTLTGYAFMKMLLGALGYDAEIEGFVGPNWSINVAKKAIGIGLNRSLEGEFNGVNYITREEAALYAFNTLRTDLVEYDQKITATVNGAEVTVGNSLAKAQTWNNSLTRHNNIRDDNYIQFAEQYFNKLVLKEDMDVFGRPDREWKYDGDEIGTYLNYDLFKQEYTAKVTGRDLYDLLGSSVVDEKDGYNFEIHVDGIETVTANKSILGSAYFTQGNLIRSNTEKIGETGNGVLTQVFVDNDKEVETVWIAVINTYLAKATADYNEKKDEADFEVWSIEDKNNSKTDMVLVKDPSSVSAKTEKETLTVSGEDFDIENVKENDIVLVRVADGEIQEILDPEVIDSTEITSFKKNSWVKADEQYDYASTAMYDDEVLDEYDESNMKDTTYRIFLDPYGYAIGVEIIEDAAKYVFLTGIDGNTSNLRNKTADGNIIHTDGTMETVKINMEKSKALNEDFSTQTVPGTYDSNEPYTEFVPAALWNTWCTYTVNSDGVYTLTQVANTDRQMSSDDKGASRAGTKRTTDKVGQGRNATALSGSDAGYTAIIDKKHISLNGLNGPDGTGSSALYSKAYGNDDSVYINVSVNKISNATMVNPYTVAYSSITSNSGLATIIDDVDSVSTGVQSVSLKAYDFSTIKTMDSAKYNIAADSNGDHVAYGAYALFDDDGFVIAAVVVGEDDGVSSKYAYTFDNDVNKETWGKDTSKWTWTKDVIIDGELVTLEEIDDSLSELKSMRMNNWYEVKFKADGTVKEVSLIDPCDAGNGDPACPDHGVHHGQADGDVANAKDNIFCKDPTHFGSSNPYPKYVGLIEMVERAQEDNSSGKVVLFEDMWTGNADGNNLTYTLNTAGTSLQVQNATSGEVRGFAVSSAAKTVLVQDVRVRDNDDNEKSLKRMDSIEYFDGGKAGLERAIKKLNLNNKKTDEWFRGYVSAVFENGVAQTVIIYEKLPNDVNWGSDDNAPSGDINVEIANGTIKITAPSNATIEDIANDVVSKLKSLGYEVENRDIVVNGNVLTSVTASKNGISYHFDLEVTKDDDPLPDDATPGHIDPETQVAISGDTISVVDNGATAATEDQVKAALTEFLKSEGYTTIEFSYTDGKLTGVSAAKVASNGTVTKKDLTVATVDVAEQPADKDALGTDPMKAVISTGLRQEVVAGEDGAVIVKLSGSLQKVTSATEGVEDALEDYAGAANKAYNDFVALYKIKADTLSFVNVTVNDDTMTFMIGQPADGIATGDVMGGVVPAAGQLYLVRRVNSGENNGKLYFESTRTRTLGGETVTIDISGLR